MQFVLQVYERVVRSQVKSDVAEHAPHNARPNLRSLRFYNDLLQVVWLRVLYSKPGKSVQAKIDAEG